MFASIPLVIETVGTHTNAPFPVMASLGSDDPATKATLHSPTPTNTSWIDLLSEERVEGVECIM